MILYVLWVILYHLSLYPHAPICLTMFVVHTTDSAKGFKKALENVTVVTLNYVVFYDVIELVKLMI